MNLSASRTFRLGIRGKVILPYLVLALAVAILGTYIVTRLVFTSLQERLTNQLLEAGRVVLDGMARQEIKHLEAARIIAFTQGLAESLASQDGAQVHALAEPVAAGLGVENLIVVDANGHEVLHLLQQANNEYQVQNPTLESSAANLWIVQAALAGLDPNTPPQRALGLHPANQRYYYFTAVPVSLNGSVVGAVIVGTSLDTLLPYLKTTALADVIVYLEDGRAVASSLTPLAEENATLPTLSISPELYQYTLNNDATQGENFMAHGRWYSLARGALAVGQQRIGAFAVVLPLNFVLQAGTTSRNLYVLLFSVLMGGVVLVGYVIARQITAPLNLLVHASRSIADGQLGQHTGLQSSDELGILATTFDEMSERLAQRTNELKRACTDLERLDHSKSDFINVAAHELRTPLTLINGYIQMLESMSAGDQEKASLVQGINKGTERMIEVVNSMLDVAKIDNQILQLYPQPTSIALIIAQIQRDFATALQERRLTLTVADLESLPMIQADGDLLQKVFYHLIVNAIKYTPNGGWITIQGRVVRSKDQPAQVEIMVSDTGIGIDAEHQKLVFEKFYQIGKVSFHSSGRTTFKGGGPGLGLAIARGIVQAHHGQIWVESAGHDEKECLGSRFYVRLPLEGGTE